jgi:Holliday junction resolvase
MTAESDLKRSIMAYLNALPFCYARVIQVSGVRGRTSPTKGVFDIVGVWRGLAFAIEVKVKGNGLEDSQKDFLVGWAARGGGIALVAYSLDQVIHCFDELKRKSISKLETNTGVKGETK